MNGPFDAVQRFCSNCGQTVDLDARFCKYCAHPLTPEGDVDDQPSGSEHGIRSEDSPRRRTALWMGGGAALFLIIAGIAAVVLLFTARSSPSTDTASAAAAPTLSEKAQKTEAKILRGEALDVGDIEGLSPQELRIVRNVHFARYGRTYERPGLGDYFYSTSWYKPSESYHDNLLTQVDKNNVNLILSVEKGSGLSSNNSNANPIPASGGGVTSASGSSSGDVGPLTTEKAARAIDRWAASTRASGCNDGFSCSVNLVGGVREIPQENAAVVELKFTDFIYQPSNERNQRKYSGAGRATFFHYTDGRWVLSEIKIGDIWASTSWKPQIDAN